MSYKPGQPIFKDYILISFIGEGAFGRVYLVESPNAIRFALKVLHRGIEMEQRGVESVKGISSDYLVKVLDYGETVKGEPCILMEYYKDNLRGVIDAGKMDEAQACRCFEHILKGLMVLEKHGVMHRDIKPENLFIREGNVKIGDFGTARYTAGDTSHKSHVIGTIQYMAPERFAEKYGHPVDRWSAAVVFYRLLTGENPFKGNDRTQIFAAILRDEPDMAAVPEKYRDFLRKCFQKDEKQRHEDTKAMLTAFREATVAQNYENLVEGGEPDRQGDSPVVVETEGAEEPKPRGGDKPAREKAGGNRRTRPKIKMLPIIGIALLIGLVFLGIRYGPSIFEEKTKYGLTVPTKPEDASIQIIGSSIEYSPGVELPTGQYKVIVSMEGYGEEQITVDIVDRPIETDVVILNPVQIDSEKIHTERTEQAGSGPLRSKPITTDSRSDFALKEVENKYVDNGDGTITDKATGLMWEKSGSPNPMNYEKALEYVNGLNQKKFAEHDGWRLPMVDELWSLMEKEEMNGDLYIDPKFDATQRWCWSADKRSSGSAWSVPFDTLLVSWGDLHDGLVGLGYVRAVRSGQY